jgi:hypothetical protein
MSIGNLFGTGGESNSLYGTSLASGGSIPPSSFIYFEWFIFKVSTGQPATPTGGSWDFLTNTGIPPTGWTSTVNGVPLNNLWFCIAFVDSRNPTNIVWSTAGLLSATTSVYATAYADTFTGNGSTTAWTLTQDPVVVNNLDVSINGVTQTPVTDYTISGTTFTTTTAAPLGSIILVKYRQALPNSYFGTADNVGYTPAGTGAVATNVQAKLRQYVSVKDFGAVGNGVANDTAAIQAALTTGNSVYVPQGTYNISTTLRLNSDGQIFYGDGDGNVNEPARTILKWVGASSGKMFSISNGTTENWQNCTVKNIWFNGNSLANIAIEGYSSAVSGGAWRNRYEYLTVSGLTGANSTAFDLGSGAFPDFAHDTEISSCFIIGAVRGAIGAGSIQRFSNTTFSLCTNAITGLAGSAWTFVGCVFSQSGAYDFTGTSIQIANFTGCWFEDSTTGIYQATTSHTCNFDGCYLQTKSTNTTQLMNMGNAAGNFSIKGCFVPVSSGSTLIKSVNGFYEYDAMSSNVTLEPGYKYRSQGFVRADNGVFAAGITNDQNNSTGDGTVVSLNAVAFTEEYDTGGYFNASTGVFTAPVFGFYQFTGAIALGDVAAGHTSAYLRLVTSNDTYVLSAINPSAVRTGGVDPNYVFLQGTITVELQPSDTAYLEVVVSGSTKTVDILSGSTLVDWRTRFEGRMI